MDTKLVTSFLKSGLVATLIVASLSSYTLADTECNVPVCDISAKLEEMKMMNQTDKAQTLKNLKNKYRAETNVKVLLNLKEFADRSKNLFVELKEEDWVIREAQYLQNSSRIGLIKYDSVSKEKLIENFKALTDEGSYFEVLNYWVTQIELLEDVNEVLDLVSFAEFARKFTIETKQEDYIVREAESIIAVGGKHVSRLRPVHEGTYSVSLKCSPRPQDCKPGLSAIKHLSIMESLTSKGILVSFTDTASTMVAYLYTNAELTNNGTHISGLSTEATPYTRVSEMSLDINPVTGAVKGTIKDIESKGTITFTGTPKKRVSQYFTDSGPTRVVSVDQIAGKYKGGMIGIGATLSISKYSNGSVVGVATLSNGEITLPFKTGAYNSRRGVLVLTSPGVGSESDRKLVLALRKDSKGREYLVGFMYTTTQQTPDAYFYKVSN
ncbi:MAG: hypothetical protein ACK41T_04210 [Pseudobdellovibrio sp.]